MGVIAEVDKRQIILDATLELVAQRGLNDTPVSAIVKQSGVSTGIIYHYFEDKDAIMHALYADIKRQVGMAALAGVDLSAHWEERYRRTWRNFYRFYATHPRETLFVEQYENAPYYHHWDVSQMSDEWRTLTQAAQADMERGLIKSLPLEAFGVLMIGVAIMMAKQHILGALTLDDAALDQIAGACIDAVRA